MNDFLISQKSLTVRYKTFLLRVLVKYEYQNFHHDVSCKLQITNLQFKLMYEQNINYNNKTNLGKLHVMKLYLTKLVW